MPDPKKQPPATLNREILEAAAIFESMAPFEDPTRPIAGIHRASEPSFRRLHLAMKEAHRYLFPGMYAPPAPPVRKALAPELRDPENPNEDDLLNGGPPPVQHPSV